MCDSVDASSGLRRRRNLGKKAKTFNLNESFLPDDVVIDILRWLPAKDLLRSRCVCTKWRDLTSTKDFIDLHLRRSFTMILKDFNGDAILDRCWEPAQTRSKIHKVYEPNHDSIVLSQNGLIVAHANVYKRNSSLSSIVIYNPIYRDVVNITVLDKPRKASVYGVFFHPVMKEYCTLWRETLSLKPFKVQYKILNLESDPNYRDIKNPSTQNGRILGTSPVLIDKYIYWTVEPSLNFVNAFDDSTFNCDIMEYDTGNEEFRVIPCPVPVNVKLYNCNVNLIDIDGVVSVVQALLGKESIEINIWTLKDNGEELWTSFNYIISYYDVYPKYGLVKAIALRNGELVLQLDGRLYVCNLKHGTFRRFGPKYDYRVRFLSHVMSLVSLKNCKSLIHMVEEDDNNRRESTEIQIPR